MSAEKTISGDKVSITNNRYNGKKYTDRSIEVCRRFIVWICKHGDNADHDCFDSMYRQPTFFRPFITIFVLTRIMQN